MVINFGAGPAKLPREVLCEVQQELVEHGTSGMSVMEMSHRGNAYVSLHNDTLALVKELLDVPDNYKILLMQGGGTGLFAAVAMNLIGKTGKADYIVTGSWSSMAAKEAARYGKINYAVPKQDKYTGIPDPKQWQLDPEASYVYYCDNETIGGIEFDSVPETNGVPLVVDIIYVMGRVFAWIKRNGGVDEMYRQSMIKSELIYDVIAKSNGFYYCPVDKKVRSRMNVPFRVGGANGDEELEKQFLKGAEALGMQQLKGHRSVGGIRASLYNAVTVEEATSLQQYMLEFFKKHQKF
uniref:phosphoserine transaminase n=1 Tax=Anopheles culicifacies TaxID=139723 RepID=A0A182MDJ7_9DIPT